MSFTDALRRTGGRLAASCAALAAACGPPAQAPRPALASGQDDAATTQPPTPPSAALPAPAGAPAAALPPAPQAASAVAALPTAPAAAPEAQPAPAAVPPAPSRPDAAPARAGATRHAGAPPVAIAGARAAANWEQFRLQAARRIAQANPDITYMEPAPDPLLAIPVLEIELEADGKVRRIGVLRHPRQARDTVRIAIDAVHRAAPFGDVSKLPRPWKFVETFLFDDARRFKPRSLDDG